MSTWRVQIVSAFGRGETLALGLRDAGFQVQILDFTEAFAGEYQRGVGPFPILEQAHQPVQREYLAEVKSLPQGLTFWLPDGPIELTGPFSDLHSHFHSAIREWKKPSAKNEFEDIWLTRFLQNWAANFYCEAWENLGQDPFPAQMIMGLVPDSRESHVQSFARAKGKGIEVYSAQKFGDSRMASARIHQIEAEVGTRSVFSADQWVWCLSSHETQMFGPDLAEKLFWRGVRTPEWVWLSFAGHMQKGPWTQGLPYYSLVMGDVYLPWVYANAFALRRVDETRFRVWLKVPGKRARDIDARREWAFEVQRLLARRLSLADWKVDPSDWNLCPHSEVYKEKPEDLVTWKNWDWIGPETLSRLDLSVRWKREAECLTRLTQWKNEQMKKQKKQGARDDRALHAP